jgi:hypothetical protein
MHTCCIFCSTAQFVGPMDGARGHDETDTRHPPGRHRCPAERRRARFQRAVPVARLAAVSPRIPAVLPGCGRVRPVRGAVLDRGPPGPGGTAFDDAAAAVARPRDALRLCRCSDRRFPADGRQGLDGPGHAARRHPGGDGRAVAGSAALSSGVAVRGLCRSGRGAAALGGLRADPGAAESRQPAQPAARRNPAAAGDSESQLSRCRAGLAGHRSAAGAARRVGAGRDDRMRDRRAGDSGVHDVCAAGPAA